VTAPTAVEVVVRDVVLTTNSASDSGGALYVDAPGEVRLQRVSIVDNVATGDGGAIVVALAPVTVTVVNATISGNMSGSGMGTDLMNAGHLLLESVTLDGDVGNTGAGQTKIKRSILEPHPGKNVCTTSSITSEGDNLEHGTSCPLGATDHPDTDPLLLPLADYGKGIPIRPIGKTSPAVDSSTSCPLPAEDQLATARPIDGNESGGMPECDIGAYELDPDAEPTTTTTSTTTTSSTSTSSSTTSTTSTSLTSTTTLDPCPMDAVQGRLVAFHELITPPSESDLPPVRSAVGKLVGSAAANVKTAENVYPRCMGKFSAARRAKKLLRKAEKSMTRAGKTISSKRGVREFGVTAAVTLRAEADALTRAIVDLELLIP
jgi:hypothetical protein